MTDCWENISFPPPPPLRSPWFISVQAMDLIQEFITKLQMQSPFVFWHQRGPRKWIGASGQIGTTAHTGPARRNSPMWKSCLPSALSQHFFSPCLIKLSNFLLPIHTVQKFYIYSEAWASAHTHSFELPRCVSAAFPKQSKLEFSWRTI